jgi:hypothetical protein
MIMTYAALAIGLVGFVLIVRRLSLVRKVQNAGQGAQAAILVMRDPALDDARKQALVQRAAARTAVSFLIILGCSLLACAAPVLFVAIGWQLGLYSLDAALAAAADPIVWIALTALAILVWKLSR